MTHSWEEEFDEKVNELRRDLGPDEEGKAQTYYFGYKERRGDELFTVTDWGNIKSFIRSLLSQAQAEVRKEVLEDAREVVAKTLNEKN